MKKTFPLRDDQTGQFLFKWVYLFVFFNKKIEPLQTNVQFEQISSWMVWFYLIPDVTLQTSIFMCFSSPLISLHLLCVCVFFFTPLLGPFWSQRCSPALRTSHLSAFVFSEASRSPPLLHTHLLQGCRGRTCPAGGDKTEILWFLFYYEGNKVLHYVNILKK